jgi:hypothetical protein
MSLPRITPPPPRLGPFGNALIFPASVWRSRMAGYREGLVAIRARYLVSAIAVVAAAADPIVAGVSQASTGYRSAAGSRAASQAGAWSTARGVPGLAALSKYGPSAVNSISCATPGNCTGGGFYNDRSRRQQAFVVGEVRGAWRSATGIPHLASLNRGGGAAVSSVSCASAGNCSAGGSYGSVVGTSWRIYAFVVSEVHGRWRRAIKVAGVAALNKGVDAAASSVSCASAGNCAASGYYTDKAGNLHGFLVRQVHGRWRTATKVPGLTSRVQIGSAGAGSVSCASAGNCSSGSDYGDSGRSQAYVISEVHGR